MLTADLDNIFVVHPNGETENFIDKSRLSLLSKIIKMSSFIQAQLYMYRKTNFANSLQLASIWAPIISSIALSLTSSVLNNSN